MTKREIVNEINKVKELKREAVDEMQKKEERLGHKLRGSAKHYFNVKIASYDKWIEYGRKKLLEMISA